MATYNGTLADDILLDSLRFLSTTIKDNSPTYLTVCGLDDASVSLCGTHAGRLPVTMREHNKAGGRIISFVDDYYYRIYVDPMTLNFGAIISPLQQELLIWNAYFIPKTCSQIVEVNGDEWDLTGLTPPFELNALAQTIFTLDLPVEGSPSFEGTITFDFTNANDPVVTISGTRMALFRWQPHAEIIETLSWKTDIRPGKDGSTQRICLRQAPRQAFKFPLFIDSEQEQARLDAALFSWQKRTWGLPIWTELVPHTGTINANDTVITVDTTSADFRNESLAVIWQSPTQAEVIKVETVAAGSLTLSSPVQGTYTGRKLIMPCRTAQMSRPLMRQVHSAGLAQLEAFLAVKDNILLTGYTPPMTYKGLPVIAEATAVDPTQAKTSDGDSSLTDYETGDFDYFSDSAFNQFSQSHLFHNDTKAACWQFRLFLHSLFGMQGCVYIPTHKDDLTLAVGFGAFDTSFNIINIGLADNMGVNALRMDLAFIFPNGTHYYRAITGIVKSGSQEIITIDSSLGLAVEPGDCVICFLDKVRLARDEMELTWPGAHEHRCQLNWQAEKA